MTRSHRVLLLNALLGLGIAWFCWVGAHLPWPRADGSPGEGTHGAGRGPGAGGGPFGRGDETFRMVDVSWVAAPFLLLLAAGVALRWRWPRAAFVACVVGVGGFFGVTTFFGPVLLACALTVYPMAVTLPLRRWVGLLVLLVPVVLAAHHGEAYLGALDPLLYAQLVIAAALAVLPALVALLRRSRRESVHRDRAEDRRRTAYEERLRIAREVHDVVGHSLAVVTMQAGVALHVLDKQRAAGEPVSPEVSASLEAIRRSSRDALAELRTTLGVFREPADATRTPTAGLDRLDDLVGALRAAGRRIDVVRTPDDAAPAGQTPLPAAVDQAAFRIVQEGLTNVHKHAPSAQTVVTISGEVGREMLVSVVNARPSGQATGLPGAGSGLVGLSERVGLADGTITSGPEPGGGFAVRARLPWAAADGRPRRSGSGAWTPPDARIVRTPAGTGRAEES